MATVPDKIALIGFGEVGQMLAANFLAVDVKQVTAWDLKFADSSSAASKAAQKLGVVAAKSSADAMRGQSLVICAVTAGSAEEAAIDAAQAIEKQALYADVNSVSPGTKQRIGKIIEESGARFIEVAIMSPIGPRGIRSPMLLGGPHAAAFAERFRDFQPDMTTVLGPIGKAAATKMCRSVMYKGIEALFLESMTAARHYGVEREVLASLKDTFDKGWPETARYMISRTLIHGKRRAEEMREAAKTVAEAGLDPLVTREVAERQEWAGKKSQVGFDPNKATLEQLADALLAKPGTASK
jgi:3-hydroxyisobutyrate dehydrogenase